MRFMKVEKTMTMTETLALILSFTLVDTHFPLEIQEKCNGTATRAI